MNVVWSVLPLLPSPLISICCWEQCPGLPQICSQPARGVLFLNCIFGKLQTSLSYMAAVLGIFPLRKMHRDYFDYEKKKSLDSFTWDLSTLTHVMHIHNATAVSFPWPLDSWSGTSFEGLNVNTMTSWITTLGTHCPQVLSVHCFLLISV